ncbi:methionine--tRNA ligase, partial [Candidatus Parcubacteria bacterium]|nr:methionine--tRNA ligase [Candidatus Parcubacteria bacterium]
KANDLKLASQAFVDSVSKKFRDLTTALNISSDIHFIRTTDPHHIKAAQTFWSLCLANGDIYKKNYKIKYCVGCELEKTDSELVDGHCPLHPNLEIQIIEEENYFFKFSKYQKELSDFYQKHADFVIPDFRFNEIKAFVDRGLEDFSISRVKSKMSWGVPVPNDSEHVMYVWFDALVSYISTLGWPEDGKNFEKYWVKGTPVQYAGKDNLRQQSAMWQAMLMSAGLPNSRHVVIDGFITSGGQKMSKSLGNTVDPFELVKEFGTDAVRYYVARELSAFEDSDFTTEKFKNAYNANLANGLGNLVSRIIKMSETHGVKIVGDNKHNLTDFEHALESFNIQKAADSIWNEIGKADRLIQETEPFKLIKENREKAVEIILSLLARLSIIAKHLEPLLPETAEKIQSAIRLNKLEKPLFPRKD